MPRPEKSANRARSLLLRDLKKTAACKENPSEKPCKDTTFSNFFGYLSDSSYFSNPFFSTHKRSP